MPIETHNQSIQRVADWLTKYHCDVVIEHGEESRFEFEGTTIYINAQEKVENQLFTLLHEAGHLLIFKGNKQFAKDYPMYAHADSVCNDGRVVRGKAYQVSLVAEEIEAWRRGRRLAQRIGVRVNDDKYNKAMSDCVMSYIREAAEVTKRPNRGSRK